MAKPPQTKAITRIIVIQLAPVIGRSPAHRRPRSSYRYEFSVDRSSREAGLKRHGPRKLARRAEAGKPTPCHFSTRPSMPVSSNVSLSVLEAKRTVTIGGSAARSSTVTPNWMEPPDGSTKTTR